MSDASQLQICFVSSADEADEITQVVELLEASSGALGLDTETTGLDPLQDRVRLIQLASEDVALVVDLAAFREGDRRRVDWTRAGLRDLRRLIVGGRPKVIQNAAFDLNFLRGEGLVVGGHIFDTMIASKVLNNGHPNRNDLGSIVSRELGWDMSKELQKADWAGELSSEMVLYAARDASALPQLVPPLMEKLKRSRVGEVTLWDVFKLESMCLRPIAAMQWNGFGFDRARGEELRVALQGRADQLMQELLELMQAKLKARYPDEPSAWLPLNADGSFNTNPKDVGSVRLGTKRYAGFNPRAPQQMVQKLTALGVILPPNEKGKPSMDQNLLAFLRQSSELIDRYLIWKEADTQVSHIDKLLESVAPDGRIHANYRQVGTDTGRMSCIAEGQRVLAPNGPVLIEDVQIGDYVYSLDSDGAPCVKRVTNKWCNGEQDVVCVTWEAKGHQDPMYGELVCTPDHLLRTDRGWVKAEDIQFKEPVWHLRRSAPTGTRPRLYWRNYGYAAEQAVIKESYFGAVGSEWHIHHIDHDKTNNALTNLQIMSRAEHFSHHGKSRHPHWLFTDEARAKSKANNTPKYGPENPVWINASRYSLLRMLADARGRITYVPMDFDTYKRKCALAGLDLKALSRRYGAHGLYLNKRNVEEAYRLTGNTEVASKMLGIGTRRINELMLEHGIKRSNHRVINVAPAGKRLVYDLEIEDTHNFIVEELCVHNCAGPNLQQVPRGADFRSLFVAQPGHKLVVADFSQIELRVAAELSGEERMLDAYRAERDLHTETAALLTKKDWKDVTKEERTSAKLANFGLLYGAGAATLRKQAIAQYGVALDMKEAQALVSGFRAAYPRLYQWQLEEGEGTTTSVYTRYGRRRILVGRNDKFTTRINTQVQGTAGDIAKVAIAKVWEEIMAAPTEARLISMCHDELVLEAREDVAAAWEQKLKQAMEDAGALVCTEVPIVAEVSSGVTWAEAK